MKAFIFAVLTDLGINTHKIRFSNYPCGKGCGEAFVKRELPKEIKILKATNYIRKVLVVCTDADRYTVEERLKILVQEIEKAEIRWDRIQEPIVFWIPKRQVETWIRFLRNEPVDEEMSFSHSGKPVSCKEEARAFSEYCQDIKDLDCTDIKSLAMAKEEYLRICSLQIEKR